MSIAKRLSDYDNDRSVGSRLRSRRTGPLIELIQDHFERQGSVSIVDVGGERNYWNIIPSDFLLEHGVKVTIVNVPGTNMPNDDELFSFREGDACNLRNIADAHFDIAHSNSVIEHVGDWEQMQSFSIECQRVARSFFVQTPSYWFPIEPHFMRPFFHWVPAPARVAWVQRRALGHFQQAKSVDEAVAMVDSIRLLDLSMFRSLFPNAQIIRERIGFLTKSYVAVGSPRSNRPRLQSA